jgi:hypothetical protein
MTHLFLSLKPIVESTLFLPNYWLAHEGTGTVGISPGAPGGMKMFPPSGSSGSMSP